MDWPGRLGSSAFAAVVLLTGTARAAPKWRLLYVREAGTESCVAERELRQAVTLRLGYDPFSADASPAIFARVAKLDAKLGGSVELVDEAGVSRGKRELVTEAANCDEMARALALSISIAIDPEHGQAVSTAPVTSETLAPAVAPSASNPAPVQPAPNLGAPVAQRSNTPARDEPASNVKSRDASLGSSATAISMLGIAPSPAFGGGVALLGQRGPWSLGAGARLVRSPEGEVPGPMQLHVTLAAGEVALCFEHSVLQYCALGLAGASWARAQRVAAPRTDVGAFGAAGARVGVIAALSRTIDLTAQAEALGVLSPIRAQIDGQDVWSAPAFSGALGTGVRMHFR